MRPSYILFNDDIIIRRDGYKKRKCGNEIWFNKYGQHRVEKDKIGRTLPSYIQYDGTKSWSINGKEIRLDKDPITDLFLPTTEWADGGISWEKKDPNRESKLPYFIDHTFAKSCFATQYVKLEYKDDISIKLKIKDTHNLILNIMNLQ